MQRKEYIVAHEVEHGAEKLVSVLDQSQIRQVDSSILSPFSIFLCGFIFDKQRIVLYINRSKSNPWSLFLELTNHIKAGY